MMDEKMKAAFDAWLAEESNRAFARGEHISPFRVAEWTLEYLRSQQEPVAFVRYDDDGFLSGLFENNSEGRVPLYPHPVPSAPAVPDGWRGGIEAVAQMIQKKADRYAVEFGCDDMGGLSFGQGQRGEIRMDYYTGLVELADEVRAMLAAAPSPTEKKEGLK